jgi:4-diphosphocytidyl-2-C-methyl-D-erythritol kinase
VGGTALGTGRGERVEPVADAGRYHWVVATADGQIATPRAYAEVDRLRDNGIGSYASDVSGLLDAVGHGCTAELAERLHNDMTEAAWSLRPGLREVAAAGLADGALAALVSGSGPTTLFLTRHTHHAHALAARLRMRRVAHDIHLAAGPVPGAQVM